MGLVVDANVFIQFERKGLNVDFSKWAEPAHDVFISAITVSELLMGVHRADTDARRTRRNEFVEAIFASVSVLDFTTAIARRHAELYSDLAAKGQLMARTT